jgi:hypothetical protein
MRAQSLAVVVFSLALALPGAAQSAPQEAGQVSALLPAAHVERGSSSPLEVKLRDPIFWRDWFETEEKARARLSLVDGSLLNVGSKARVQVVENNQATERTELELKFGKVRAQVKERTQPGGRFEIRTDTAVIGVIGTHVYVDGAGPLTTVINFGGKVQVSSSDPTIKKNEFLEQFELAEVERGQPIRKRMATLQELLQALEDTLPGLVTRLIPQRVRAGSCVSASSGDSIGGLAGQNPNAPNLELAPRGCEAPDITPLRICAPATAAPGVYEYALQGADGIQRWAAYVIEPPAELQDAWLVYVDPLPLGSTHTARLVGKEDKPLPGVPVHIRQGGEEKTVATDEEGGFVIEARQLGPVEVEVSRGGGEPTGPFEDIKPIKVTLQVVEKIDEKPEMPEFSQRGSLVTVPGEVASASLGERALPVLKTVLRNGRTLSSVPVPRDIPEGARSLDLTDPSGERRSRELFVYDILGGRLDQNLLNSGAVTQGEFLVCVAGGPQKVKAHIVAAGPVHFRGRGGKGKRFEQSFSVSGTGLLRIPFQIQAEKGSPTGIPFALMLRLERD